METALLSVFFAAVVAAIVHAAAASRSQSEELAHILLEMRAVHGEISADLRRLADGPEGTVSQRMADLEHEIGQLPRRWEEFRNEAKRAESRARSVVRDARKELESVGYTHAGVEAAAGELRLIDGDGGEGEGVPAMHPGMGHGPEVGGEEFKDYRALARQRKYGG